MVYAGARSKLGDDYSKSKLSGFCHTIEWYLNAPLLNKGLELSSDPRFKRSNKMLNPKVLSLKRHTKENVQHKPTTVTRDWCGWDPHKFWHKATLLAYFEMFGSMWFASFAERVERERRTSKKESFKFEVDPTDWHYATMAHEASKIILVKLAKFRAWKSTPECMKHKTRTTAIKPWSSTSPSWTQTTKRYFNILAWIGVSKTTSGMKHVPLGWTIRSAASYFQKGTWGKRKVWRVYCEQRTTFSTKTKTKERWNYTWLVNWWWC